VPAPAAPIPAVAAPAPARAPVAAKAAADDAAQLPADPERLKAVRDFFTLLRKGVKNIGMYRHDPKRFPAFLKPAQQLLDGLVAGGAVVLVVQAEAFVFEKEPVWAIEAGENIPGRFFREGIRQLIFRPGLSADELNKLVTIMLSNPDRGGEEILSQLFNASFEHVGYATAKLFAYGDLTEEQVNQEELKLIGEFERRYAFATPEIKARADAMARAVDARLAAMEPAGAPYVVDGKLTAAFLERAHQDAEKDDTLRLHRRLVSLVLMQLKAGLMRDPAQAAELFAQLLDGMLSRGDLSPLAVLLSGLEGTEIKAALALRMCEEPRLRQLGLALNSTSADWAGATRYLLECRASAAPVLLDLLTTLEVPAARALVLEAVAALDKDAGSNLTAKLDTVGAHVVPDLIAFSEHLPPTERSRLVEKAMRHPSTAVRLEAVRSLLKCSAPESVHRFALEATTDKAPQVRFEAFRALVKLSRRRAAQDLMRLPKLPDWDKRPQDEKELIFECLGSTEQDEAFSYALSLLQVPKKGLFGHKRVEMKLLAIRALSQIQNLQAFKALQGVGAMPEQDAEATAAATAAAQRLRTTMLPADKHAEPTAAPQPHDEPLPAEAVAALEALRKGFAARQPPSVASPSAPGVPPTAAIFSGAAATVAAPAPMVGDDSAPKGPAPAWATPKPKGGGQ